MILLHIFILLFNVSAWQRRGVAKVAKTDQGEQIKN